MSMHNKPLTTIEEAGLILHGMGREIGKPSMSADILRHGIEFGQMTHADQIQCIQDQLDHEMPFDAKLRGRLTELLGILKSTPHYHAKMQFLDRSKEKVVTLLWQGKCDGTVEAFEVNGMMTIPSSEGVTYVQREDAVKFFGLVDPLKIKMAPVQGYVQGIPWDMHLEAYNVYCKKYGKQQALIEGNCRGGFGVSELNMFIPGWRDKLSLVGQLKSDVESLSKNLDMAIKRINDLLLDDDGQAYKEARKFIESLKP